MENRKRDFIPKKRKLFSKTMVQSYHFIHHTEKCAQRDDISKKTIATFVLACELAHGLCVKNGYNHLICCHTIKQKLKFAFTRITERPNRVQEPRNSAEESYKVLALLLPSMSVWTDVRAHFVVLFIIQCNTHFVRWFFPSFALQKVIYLT